MRAIEKIAGKIVPAIMTMRIMVCGLTALETYKGHAILLKRIEEFGPASVNLRIHTFALSEP
jgi:hypothetical protein